MPAPGRFGSLLLTLRHIVGDPSPAAPGDGQLLHAFLQHGNQDAFAALVERHGAMVLGVGRRVLNNTHDAEDVLQATFLVLARNAPAIRKRESLASWLHGVAYRLALKSKTHLARLRAREQKAEPRRESDDPDVAWRELHAMLDEELQRLPDKYRRPLLLCYFEHQAHEEAARTLGWPIGTVKTRVARAKELLRTALTRRGLTLSGAALTTALAAQSPAGASAALAQTTTQAALALLHGAPVAEAASAPVAALLDKAFAATAPSKLALVAATLCTGIFAGVLITRPTPDRAGPPPDPLPIVPAAAAALAPAAPDEDLATLPECHRKMLGGWHLAAAESRGLRETRPQPLELRFTKNVVTWKENSTRRLTYTVDPSVWPKAIDITDADGAIVRGIYDHKGDFLWLCFGAPGGPRPAAFEAPLTAPLPQRLLLLGRASGEAREANGLRIELNAPSVIAADLPECPVQMHVTNVSQAPIRVARWVDRGEGRDADFDVRLVAVDRPDAEAVKQAMNLLQPGESLSWDLALIPNAAFRQREALTVVGAYSVPDPEFAAKYQTWQGSIQARPVIIRVAAPAQSAPAAKAAALKPAARLDLGQASTGVIATSPEGNWLAVATRPIETAIEVFDLKTMKRVARQATPWHVGAVALAADRRCLAATGGDYLLNKLEVWDARGQSIVSATLDSSCQALAFTADHQALVAVTDAAVETWDLARRSRVSVVKTAGQNPVAAADAGRIVLAWDERLGLIDVASKQPWRGPTRELIWLGLSPVTADGQAQLAVVEDWFPLAERPWAERRSTLQRRTAGKRVPDWLVPAPRGGTPTAAPGGRWLVNQQRAVVDGKEHFTITLHDAATGKQVAAHAALEERFVGFAAHPLRLLTAGRNFVRVWDVVEADAPPPTPPPSTYGYGYTLPRPAYVAPPKK